MDIKKFNTASEFAEYIAAYYKETKHTWQYDISIVAPFRQIRDIATELIRQDCGIDYIEDFSYGLLDNYADEYVIDIVDGNIAITKAKYNDEYLSIDPTICYVSDECNAKVLKAIESDDIYELHIGDDEELSECDSDCDNCHYSSTVKVNGKDITDSKEKEKTIHDILTEYCEEMDKYNERLNHWNYIDSLIDDVFARF